jgi:hypothetical protein
VITRSPFAAALFSTANVDYALLLTNIPQVEPPQSENFRYRARYCHGCLRAIEWRSVLNSPTR